MESDDKKIERIEKGLNLFNKGIRLIFLLCLGYSLYSEVDRVNELEKESNKYLESLESDKEINEKLDKLIEEFCDTYDFGKPLGDEIEKYFEIELDSSKKDKVNNFSSKTLSDIINVLVESKKNNSNSLDEGELYLENLLKDSTNVVAVNISCDNDFLYGDDNQFNVDEISFNYGKDYGWIQHEESYKISDDMLNEYVSACELLSDRSTYLCAHMDEFDSMLEGVVKSSICDVKLENSGSLARVDVVIPDDVRTFVKTK